MQTPPGHGPEEKRHIFGTHIGDLGLVLIAFLCTVIVILILFSPSPADRLEKAQARQGKERILAEKAERQRKIDEAVASGVVTVGITPRKH